MGSAIHPEDRQRANGHKGNGRRSAASRVESAESIPVEEDLAALSLPAALRFSRLPEKFSAPVQEIANDLRSTLRDFIQQHPLVDCLMGFNRGNLDPVPVAPLMKKLESWEARLEGVIQSQRGLPPELCPIRLFAIGLQSNIEMFALVLRSSANEGELAVGRLPHVLEQAISLKAEAGVLMAKMDSLSLSDPTLH